MRSLFLGRLLALHEQYPALYCSAEGDIRRQKGPNETYIGRTSRVVLDRGELGARPQPLRGVEVARLGGGDHADDERPEVSGVRQRLLGVRRMGGEWRGTDFAFALAAIALGLGGG